MAFSYTVSPRLKPCHFGPRLRETALRTVAETLRSSSAAVCCHGVRRLFGMQVRCIWVLRVRDAKGRFGAGRSKRKGCRANRKLHFEICGSQVASLR